MNTSRLLSKSALAVAISGGLMLGGCSNGGNNEYQPGNNDYSILEGIAAKGLIIKGLVEAWELDATGRRLRQVGTAVTDDEGKYRLPLTSDYGKGPIQLVIKPQSDTKMICDVKGGGCEYGKPVSLPDDFSLTAILPPSEKRGTVSAQITPLTHMAAKRVFASGQFSAPTIKDAISEVSNIIGVDVLETPPVDITKATGNGNDDAIVYAAFMAGMSQVALEKAGGLGKLTEGVELLAKAFEDGKFDTTDKISIGEIISATRKQAAAANISGTKVAYQLARVEAKIIDGSYDPEPTPSTATGTVELAKELVGQVRNWYHSLEAFQEPAEAFKGDVELAGEVFNQNAQAQLELFGDVLVQVGDFFDKIEDRSQIPGKHTVSIVDHANKKIGDVLVNVEATENDGVDITIISKPKVSGTVIAFEIDTDIPGSALTNEAYDTDKLNMKVTGKVENDKILVQLNEISLGGKLAESIHVALGADDGSQDEPDGKLVGAAFSGDVVLKEKTKNVEFKGEVAADLVKLTKPYKDSGNTVSLKYAMVKGEVSASDGRRLDVKAELNVSNAAIFDTFAFLDDEPDLWLYGYMNGKLTKDEVRKELAKQYPEALEIQHVYIDSDPNRSMTWYSALIRLPDMETAEYFGKATLTISTDLTLKGRPETRLIASGSRRGFKTATAFISLIDPSHELNIGLRNEGEAAGTGTVTFTNDKGAKMTITAAEKQKTGELIVNGTKVGTVDFTKHDAVIIRYDDGTFESLI